MKGDSILEAIPYPSLEESLPRGRQLIQLGITKTTPLLVTDFRILTVLEDAIIGSVSTITKFPLIVILLVKSNSISTVRVE